MKNARVKNNEPIATERIPVADYDDFLEEIVALVSSPACHVASYFALDAGGGAVKLVCCIADDDAHDIAILSSEVEKNGVLPSATAHAGAFERFEREIAENTDLVFDGHPWMKPLRTAPDDYPFYHMEGEELHEVGVGPIHAGVIEPGHFRFVCNGEKVLHLEIMLGYQHRGVEDLFLEKRRLNQRAVLAESIAGDTAVGHGVVFANAWEALCGHGISRRCRLERTLASELERIAIHTGDLGAICGDVAYQLGSAVYGRLRTPVINFMQRWCGNRLGKGCVRPFAQPFPFTKELGADLLGTLGAYERDFLELSAHVKHFPSVLARLERTGVLTQAQAEEIGAVGMAARASNLRRDVRASHPYLEYGWLGHNPVTKHHGDVLSRTQVRISEVEQSLEYARRLVAELEALPGENAAAAPRRAAANSMVVSLGEGWRGEICHVAVTDGRGELARYKIKDPSFHNWMALALAVRGNEISDFPICNKSFNLSYAGHDL